MPTIELEQMLVAEREGRVSSEDLGLIEFLG